MLAFCVCAGWHPHQSTSVCVGIVLLDKNTVGVSMTTEILST